MECAGCGKLIARGTPRWAGREPQACWHYACAERAGLARAVGGERDEEAKARCAARIAFTPNAASQLRLQQEGGRPDRRTTRHLASRAERQDRE